METKAAPIDRLDALDAERFRDMLASPPFVLLKERVTKEWERAREACAQETELRDIYRAQGRVAALRVALDLPNLILKEIEKRK